MDCSRIIRYGHTRSTRENKNIIFRCRIVGHIVIVLAFFSIKTIMKRQSSTSSSSLGGGEKRNRHSSRTTVLSKAFRVVDAETRQEVRNKRIQQLEADNYGDADVDGQSAVHGQDDEAYQDDSDDSTQKKKKKKVKPQKTVPFGTAMGGSSAKRSTRKVRSLDRIVMEQGYQYHLQPAATGKSKQLAKKGTSSTSVSATATVMTIKEEDEEEGGDGNDEEEYMDVDGDAYGNSSSSSSSKRGNRGMKNVGKIATISSSTIRGEGHEDEVEIVDSPFVFPNTLSIAGTHVHILLITYF